MLSFSSLSFSSLSLLNEASTGTSGCEQLFCPLQKQNRWCCGKGCHSTTELQRVMGDLCKIPGWAYIALHRQRSQLLSKGELDFSFGREMTAVTLVTEQWQVLLGKGEKELQLTTLMWGKYSKSSIKGKTYMTIFGFVIVLLKQFKWGHMHWNCAEGTLQLIEAN